METFKILQMMRCFTPKANFNDGGGVLEDDPFTIAMQVTLSCWAKKLLLTTDIEPLHPNS